MTNPRETTHHDYDPTEPTRGSDLAEFTRDDPDDRFDALVSWSATEFGSAPLTMFVLEQAAAGDLVQLSASGNLSGSGETRVAYRQNGGPIVPVPHPKASVAGEPPPARAIAADGGSVVVRDERRGGVHPASMRCEFRVEADGELEILLDGRAAASGECLAWRGSFTCLGTLVFQEPGHNLQ